MAERLASFRGVPFHLVQSELAAGRRTKRHDLPQRPDPDIEDLGLAPEEFSLEGFVLGDDHRQQALRIQEACSREGPGVLVHPWRGTVTVTCLGFRERETSRERRITYFALTFVRTGRTEHAPLSAPDPEGLARRVVDAITAALAASWDADLDAAVLAAGSPVPGEGESHSLAQAVLDGYESGVDEVQRRLLDLDLSSRAAVVSDLAGRIADLDSAEPQDLPGAIGGIARELYVALGEGDYALSVLVGLAESDAVASGGSSPLQKAASKLEGGAVDLLRAESAASALEAATAFDWESYDDALRFAERLAAALDALEGSVADQVFEALQGIRSTLRAGVPAPDSSLPRVAVVELPTSLPAVVLAHRLYASPERGDQLAARNRAPHPGFLPAATPLEVLVEAEG